MVAASENPPCLDLQVTRKMRYRCKCGTPHAGGVTFDLLRLTRSCPPTRRVRNVCTTNVGVF